MTEAEIGQKFLARANPPSLLFRYRRPSDWTLSEIAKCQVFAAKPEALNDPFEYCTPIFLNVDSIRRLFIEEIAPTVRISPEDAAKRFDSSEAWGMARLQAKIKETMTQAGIVCLSARPRSIRMWSYYAQAHEGICIGYDTRMRPFNVALKVKYQNPDSPFDVFANLNTDPTEFAANVALRKAEEWEFEEEYRIPINIGDYPRLIPFDPIAIQEVRLGARIKAEFKAKVLEAIAQLPHRPKLIQMGCDFDRFVLTEAIV